MTNPNLCQVAINQIDYGQNAQQRLSYKISIMVQNQKKFQKKKNLKTISGELAELYKILSKNLDQIKAKELEADKKIELINENLELEHRVENKMA